MSKIYKNPPIQEAICEFRFASDQQWDWTIPGLVFSQIKDKYPKKKEVKRVGMELKTKQFELESKVIQGVERMQFLNEDENRLIQVGENLIAKIDSF